MEQFTCRTTANFLAVNRGTVGETSHLTVFRTSALTLRSMCESHLHCLFLSKRKFEVSALPTYLVMITILIMVPGLSQIAESLLRNRISSLKAAQKESHSEFWKTVYVDILEQLSSH